MLLSRGEVTGIIVGRRCSLSSSTLPSPSPMSSFVARVGRARLAAASATARAALKPRYFSTSLRRQDEEDTLPTPKPPPTIDDSTSALDYKRIMRHRPPPLPSMDLPRSRTAEEAVTNILYNTPPPSLQPFKKWVTNVSSRISWTR